VATRQGTGSGNERAVSRGAVRQGARADGTRRRPAAKRRPPAARAGAHAPSAAGECIYHLVADSSPDWEYIMDEQIRIIYSSPSAKVVTGLTTEQMTADPDLYYHYVHPDDLCLVLQHDATFAGPGPPAELEYRYLHPALGERWMGHVCRPLFDSRGRFVGRRGTVRDITQRRDAERQVREARAGLEDKVRKRTAELQTANAALQVEIAGRRRLEEEVLRISEWEQERLGHDLHDDLCQQLAGIAYLCESVQPEIRPRNIRVIAKVQRIHRLLNRALADARGMARGLSPLALETRGIKAALRDLAAAVSSAGGARCRVTCRDSPASRDLVMATHVYRIAQEAIHNAIRHGRAKTIRIALRPLDRGFRLTIEDDGRGLPRRRRRNQGMGLGSMQYRARAMGGTFSIARRPSGRGTIVTCDVAASNGGAGTVRLRRRPSR
jgi:PAS domain S-box-containing protein